MPKRFYVYIVGSASGVLYIGSTSDIRTRIWQHRHGTFGGFTSRYRVHRLLWFEGHSGPLSMVGRERQLKGWIRARKVQLIESTNAGWRDLAQGWYEDDDFRAPRGHGGTG